MYIKPGAAIPPPTERMIPMEFMIAIILLSILAQLLRIRDLLDEILGEIRDALEERKDESRENMVED